MSSTRVNVERRRGAEVGVTPYPRRYWALAALCLSLLLIALDNTILNVALPTLVRELDASASELQWIVDAYVLVFAGLLLTAGSLGDRFGRKGALNLGLLIFAAGALLATQAREPGQLIAMRAVMGVGGAFIMPATLSLITNIFPAHERARAIGVWAGVAGLGIAIGPVTGGWLLEHFSWGSIFLVNVPVVVIALAAGYAVVPTSRDADAPPIDFGGAVLSVAGLGAVLYAIIEAPRRGWTDGATLAWFAVAIVLLAAFVWWELRARFPMLDMGFFSIARFSAASGAVTLVFFALFGSLFLLTQYLQFVLAFTAFEAGIRVLPMALTIMIAAPLSARVVERLGTKLVVAAGLSLAAAGLAWLSTLTVADGYGQLLPRLIVLAAGMGLTMAPATESIMGALPLARAGVGSAVNDATRQVGGAFGVAVLGSLLSSRYGDLMSARVEGLPPVAAAAASDSVGAALQVAGTVGGAQGAALAAAARAGFVEALGVSVLVGAAVALAGAVVALVFLPARGVDPDAAAAEDGVPA